MLRERGSSAGQVREPLSRIPAPFFGPTPVLLGYPSHVSLGTSLGQKTGPWGVFL